ncbi:MAG: hypothetical protein J5722_06970, partial [Oscillospiraceae bacterium]|nr:hypothetical protein [Oscillospiraceae bacterium]
FSGKKIQNRRKKFIFRLYFMRKIQAGNLLSRQADMHGAEKADDMQSDWPVCAKWQQIHKTGLSFTNYKPYNHSLLLQDLHHPPVHPENAKSACRNRQRHSGFCIPLREYPAGALCVC